MSVQGQSTAWANLFDSMVPTILRVVVETCCAMQPPAPDQLEDDITNGLCMELRRNRDVRELPFYVITQMVILEEDVGNLMGRMDVAFLPTATGQVPNENTYFCLECKRLNVVTNGRKRSYASEYVKFGLLRFVTGQYSHSVQHGGMVGYVLDGDINNAMNNIEKNIRRSQKQLRVYQESTFLPSSFLSGEDSATVRESHHQRKGETSTFLVHHIFVPGTPGNNA